MAMGDDGGGHRRQQQAHAGDWKQYATKSVAFLGLAQGFSHQAKLTRTLLNSNRGLGMLSLYLFARAGAFAWGAKQFRSIGKESARQTVLSLRSTKENQ